MDSSIELAEFFFFTIFIKMVALQWIALQYVLFDTSSEISKIFSPPQEVSLHLEGFTSPYFLRVDGLAWNRLSFSLLHCGILVITLRILFSGAKSAQGKVLSKASSLIPSLEIKFSDLKEILDFGFFQFWNFLKFQILKCLKMSNDRNSRLYHARDSVYGRNSTYGRSSVQSGNDGLTGRSSMSPGRTSNRLSPVPDRKSTSQRTSNVSNPPSTNSNNRKRYFNRGLEELLWFLKNLKS